MPPAPPRAGRTTSTRHARGLARLLCGALSLCLVSGLVVLGLVVLGLVGVASPALASPSEANTTAAKSTPVFDRFARAWQARDAGAVAGTMNPSGTARFTLLAYPMSGKTRSMKPAQARVSLKAYFRKINGSRLKDVTPRGSPTSVRHYEFRYRPARENQRKTRLQVQLKKDRKGVWRLASVTEST